MAPRRALQLAADIERELATLGTKARAVGAKAYLKSDLDFFGVTTPVLRRAVKHVVRDTKDELQHDELVSLVRALWKRPVFELRAAAVEWLVARGDLLGPADAALLEDMFRTSKTWALVDPLATQVMGALVVAHPRLGSVLDRWAKDDDFWVRRAALLSLLVPLRQGAGDFDRFGRYADAMLPETEFFIRKAIGWILRETGRKTPDRVFAWLLPRASRAAGLTVREATKYLPAKQRAQIERARRA